MSTRTGAAILAREARELDWPRVLLAIVAAFAVGRILCDAGTAGLTAAVCAIGFISSQLSLTREFGVPLVYFAAPLGSRELSAALAVAPALACSFIGLAFAAGASTRTALDPSVLLAAAEAAVCCALIMQSARLRTGSARTAYRTIALAAAAGIAAASLLGFAWAGPAMALPCLGFALRGFSETLRRYDPA
jgi:hypothetical protein